MENNPKPVYHNPNPSPHHYPMNLNFDSHDSFKTVDSHDHTDIDQTTIEQYNFENFYPNAMAPVQAPHHAPVPAQGPMATCPETFCPPMCLPGEFDPPMQSLTNTVQNVVIPHYHPTHVNHNMHTHYVHEHYFPHSESCSYSTSCEEVFCGQPVPPCPCPMPAPYQGGMMPHPQW